MGNPKGVQRDFEKLEERRLLAARLLQQGVPFGGNETGLAVGEGASPERVELLEAGVRQTNHDTAAIHEKCDVDGVASPCGSDRTASKKRKTGRETIIPTELLPMSLLPSNTLGTRVPQKSPGYRRLTLHRPNCVPYSSTESIGKPSSDRSSVMSLFHHGERFLEESSIAPSFGLGLPEFQGCHPAQNLGSLAPCEREKGGAL